VIEMAQHSSGYPLHFGSCQMISSTVDHRPDRFQTFQP
jgi:hypothetical protein